MASTFAHSPTPLSQRINLLTNKQTVPIKLISWQRKKLCVVSLFPKRTCTIDIKRLVTSLHDQFASHRMKDGKKSLFLGHLSPTQHLTISLLTAAYELTIVCFYQFLESSFFFNVRCYVLLASQNKYCIAAKSNSKY